MIAGPEKGKGVSPAAVQPPHQDIHESHQAIAHQWYIALLSVGSFQLDRTEALQKFSQLTDRVIAFLLAENPQVTAARQVGVGLADLPCIDPLALEISGNLWTSQNVLAMFPYEPVVLYPRLAILLNGMAVGFNRRTREIVLSEQEEIRSAMAADLLQTTKELRKYQTKLEDMLAERTRELRESEEQFRVIADTSVEGIYQSIGSSGTLIYVNNAFAKMLGYTKEELVGRDTVDFIAEGGLAKSPQISTDLQAKRSIEGEMQLKPKEGNLIDVSFSVVPTILNGRMVRSGILQDITEQKRIQAKLFQSEERYRTLAEASPDMIYIIGLDDRIQYANSFAAAFLDLPMEEIVGQPRTRFFPPYPNDYQEKHLHYVMKLGKAYYSEAPIKFNDKSVWHSTWLVPLRNAQGDNIGVMGVSRDITKQKQAELEIRLSRDQLEKRVKERTAELAISQNQLRQLTNQLVTSLEEERRRISRELHDNAGQALISLKYGLASIEGQLHKDRVGARERLAVSMELIDRVMLQIRNITHSLRPPALEIMGINLCLKDYCNEISKQLGTPVQYQGDEVPDLPDAVSISLYRFVQEALTNTVKHSHATRVEVKLQYKKDQIVLMVADNGCGMESSTKSDGIGLIGIEERLNLIGGTLKINSSRGKGVKITAKVPWPRQENSIQNQTVG